METVIEIQGLTKSFGHKTVVDHLDLSVPRGSIFALLGDNGAGKTTTLRLLTGLLPPDAGRALVLGKDCWRDAAWLRHKVGYVPERPAFYDWMTVAEIGWFTAGFHDNHYLPRFREWQDKLQLEANAPLKTLSKGQYAKVGLALAMALDPEVLVLDEPTSGLDLLVRREFLTSMVGLASEGRTILIASHQVAEVERVASHVAFLAKGKLFLTATLEELRLRLRRLQLRYDNQPPRGATLGGRVLTVNGSGKLWRAVIQDPDRAAVEALKNSAEIHDVEECPLALEEAYCALLAGKETP
jgi:ABC-2 type transport system ATP-binding protein